MKLTLEIIESYGFESETTKPDWDDVQVEYTLPNGIRLSALTVCCNQPCNVDSLEGVDGFIYIETKEELDILISKSAEEIFDELAEKYDNFNKEEYL